MLAICWRQPLLFYSMFLLFLIPQDFHHEGKLNSPMLFWVCGDMWFQSLSLLVLSIFERMKILIKVVRAKLSLRLFFFFSHCRRFNPGTVCTTQALPLNHPWQKRLLWNGQVQEAMIVTTRVENKNINSFSYHHLPKLYPFPHIISKTPQ